MIVAGKPFNREIRELKTGRAIFSFGLFDLTDSITCKLIGDGEEIKNIDNQIANAMYIRSKVRPKSTSFLRISSDDQ